MSPTKKETLEKSYLCHHLGKYHVKNMSFSFESAHKLLLNLQGKKADHSTKAKLSAYNTLFHLSKKGAFGGRREKMPYLSIERFFVFKSEPHLIFLGIEKKKCRSYVVLLLRDVKEVNEICDIIERKKGGLCRETDVHTESEVVVCYETQEEKEPTIAVCYEHSVEEQPKPILVSHQTQSEPMEERVVYVNTESKYVAPVVKSKIEHHFDQRHTDDMGTTTIDALLARTNRTNIDPKQLEEDMKYLEYNPMKGTATETDVGPIYMYTAHFTPADFNNIGSCESDDDSWSGKSVESRSSSDHQGMIMKKNDGKTVVMAHRGSDAGLHL